MSRVHTVAKQLKALGVAVLSVESEEEDTDAEIKVSEKVSVQVGCGYLIVNRVSGSGDDWCMHHFPARKTAQQVAADVQTAIEQEKREVSA